MPISNQQIYDELQTIKEKLTVCATEIGHLPELKDDVSDMRKCITSLQVNVGKLEVKSGIIGAIAGGIIIAVNYLIQSIRQ